MHEPYSRKEIESITDDVPPSRGEYCHKCGNFIPRFAELTSEEEERLRQLTSAEAMRQLRDKTGAPLSWAKLWLLHEHGPEPTAPCPKCGKPLRTAQAQQCLECGADWHNKTPGDNQPQIPPATDQPADDEKALP